MTRSSSKPMALSLPCPAPTVGGVGVQVHSGAQTVRMQRYYAQSLRRTPAMPLSGAPLSLMPVAMPMAPGPRAMLVLPPPLVDSCPADKSSRSSTWTSYQGSAKTFSSELERGERIKPERANRRNAVQKMQWRSSRWVTGFAAGEYLGGPEDADLDHRISSMTIADVSPRFAVKRILLLYENQQYREAANFINRLSHGTFKVSPRPFGKLNRARTKSKIKIKPRRWRCWARATPSICLPGVCAARRPHAGCTLHVCRWCPRILPVCLFPKWKAAHYTSAFFPSAAAAPFSQQHLERQTF